MIQRNFSATRVVASTVGVFAGLLGLEHGYFETLQRNVPTRSLVISAIGSPCRMDQAWNGCYLAMTIIPSFFATGLLVIVVSLVVILWAGAFAQKKNGGLVLILLSIMQLLVGGGFVPPFLGILAGIVGTRINAPLTWWHTRLSVSWRRLLCNLWPWPLIAFVLWGPTEWILGYFFNDYLLNLALLTALFTIGLLLLAILTGFAHDIQRQTDWPQASSRRA